jgi:hypothetical protein
MTEKTNFQDIVKAEIAGILDGNGIKTADITVHQVRNYDSQLTGRLDIALLAKSETRKSVGPPPSNSEICADSLDFNRRVRDIETTAASDNEIVHDVMVKITNLPGLGWGADRYVISLGRPIRWFSYSETCQNCQGTTQAVCDQCHGSGQKKCADCGGTGHETCQTCFGKPIMGPTGPQFCQTCKGSSLQSCRNCKGSTVNSCQNCGTKGRVPCPVCKENGAITITARIDLSAQATFVIDPTSIPEPLRPILQQTGFDQMAKSGIARKIFLLDQQTEKGSLKIHLGATVPWAQVDMMIGKRKLPLVIYGEKPVLGPIPNILERMLAPGIESLRQAVFQPTTGKAMIRNACRYRLLRLACQWAIKNPDTMVSEIQKIYPHGISQEKIQEISDYLQIILQNLTKAPRYQALSLCLAINSILAAVNVWFGWRERLADLLNNPKAAIAVDLGLPILGMVTTMMIVSYVSQRSLKFALPGLFFGGGTKMDDQSMASKMAESGAMGRNVMAMILLVPVFHLIAIQSNLIVFHDAPPWFISLTKQNTLVQEKPPKRVGKDPIGLLEWNLSRLGFQPGYIDGKIDKQAQKAIMALEKAAGKPLTGQPTESNQQLAMVAIEDHIFLDYGTNSMALGPAISNRLRSLVTPDDVELASASLRSALHSLEVPISWINEKNGHSGDIAVLEADNDTGCIRVRHRLSIGLPQIVQGMQNACWSGSTQKWIFHPD